MDQNQRRARIIGMRKGKPLPRPRADRAPDTELPPADGSVRVQLLHVLDFHACQRAGFTREGLLAAYDASRVQAIDQAGPSRRAGLRDELVKALGQISTVPPVAHRREQADHVLAVLYRERPWLRAEAEDAAASVSSAEMVAADQTALRDRIVAMLLTTRRTGYDGAADHGRHRYDARCALCAGDVDALTDAVLAMLPATADRRAVLREAADAIDAETRQAKADQVLEPDKYRPCRDASAQLRRMADETPAAETDDTGHACPGRWGGPDCRCFDTGPAAGARQDDETPAAECPECSTAGACNGGPCPLRRRADETPAARPHCVCGDPIEWRDYEDGSGWIHSPGSDTPCLNARPADETQPAECSCAVLRTGPGRHLPECPNGSRRRGAAGRGADMTADPYRRLLAVLEQDCDRQLEAARRAKHSETQIAASSMASAFLHAAAMAVREFEGPAAAQAYMERAARQDGAQS